MDENNITWIEADKLQPSQFYINKDALEILRSNFDSRLFEPVPIKIWKEIKFQKPDYIKIFHEDEWIKLPENIKENFRKVDKFFRIKHPLEQIGQYLGIVIISIIQ